MCDDVRCHYVPLPSSLQFLSPHPIYSLWGFDFSRSEDWLLPGPAGGELCSDRWISVWSECPKYVDFLKWIPSLPHSFNKPSVEASTLLRDHTTRVSSGLWADGSMC